MNKAAVSNVVSALLIVLGLFILSCIPVSMMMGDKTLVMRKLFISGVVPIGLGIYGYYSTRGSFDRHKLGIREGFGIVFFSWLAAGIFGAVPFIYIQDMRWCDAFFETVSGFTTTGASVLDNALVLRDGSTLKVGIPDLPYGLIYWRSVTHLLGGMGIVVLSIAILPFLGLGGHQLFNAESSGFSTDQITPKIAASAKILWAVYLLLIVLEIVFLRSGGMRLFDAVCNSYATIATGGFSPAQGNIGEYHSAYFEWVITVFMFLGGCNFILHFKAIRGEMSSYFKDEEFRWYLAVVLFGTAMIALGIFGSEIVTSTGEKVRATFGESVRQGAFCVVSTITTTGFVTANYDLWPAHIKFFIFLLLFTGACAGSTCGGIKLSRIIILVKYLFSSLKGNYFPRLICNARFNKHRINDKTMMDALVFFFLYIASFVAGTFLLLCFEETDLVTASSAVATCLGNVGPGFDKVGPVVTFSWMSPVSKTILSIEMIIGRLELLAVFVVFMPSFWKK